MYFWKVKNRDLIEINLSIENLQGTLRPDLIESASSGVSSSADLIKTHHNDSPLARQYRVAGRLVEPLKDFHKDEVRKLGTRLGLPSVIVNRHPFPGPGLAIRVLCVGFVQDVRTKS